MSRRKSAAPPVPSTEKRKEKSRFPFRRADSSRSFHEVDSPPATSGQGLTPVASQDPEPSAPPQPQFTRGETNGLTNTDGAGDRPRTNGNNFIDAPVTRNMDQPLPQVSQCSMLDEKLLKLLARYPKNSALPVSPNRLLMMKMKPLHHQWTQ
jgi:hypothetical protein